MTSMRTHYSGNLSLAELGQTVSLCGWVHRRRDHGGVIFVDLRDREGTVQIVCDPDVPAMFSTAETLRNEFCIRVEGLVRRRPEGTENTNLLCWHSTSICVTMLTIITTWSFMESFISFWSNFFHNYF